MLFACGFSKFSRITSFLIHKNGKQRCKRSLWSKWTQRVLSSYITVRLHLVTPFLTYFQGGSQNSLSALLLYRETAVAKTVLVFRQVYHRIIKILRLRTTSNMAYSVSHNQGSFQKRSLVWCQYVFQVNGVVSFLSIVAIVFKRNRIARMSPVYHHKSTKNSQEGLV